MLTAAGSPGVLERAEAPRLRSLLLWYQLDENLLRIFRESKGASEIALIIRDLRERAAWFRQFAAAIDGAGR